MSKSEKRLKFTLKKIKIYYVICDHLTTFICCNSAKQTKYERPQQLRASCSFYFGPLREINHM